MPTLTQAALFDLVAGPAIVSLRDTLNEIARGDDYVGLRYLVTILLGLFGFVNVGLPFIVARFAAWRGPKDQPKPDAVTYEDAFKEVTSRILTMAVELDEARRERDECRQHAEACAEEKRLLEEVLRSHNIALPGEPRRRRRRKRP